MKQTISLRQALINANAVNLLDNPDIFDELASLKDLKDAIEARRDELHDPLVEAATRLIPDNARTENGGGSFVHNGRTFALDVKNDFSEIITEPQRFQDAECVDYRYQAKVRDRNRAAAKACTANMDADVKTYRINHPDYQPPILSTVVKVID